MLIEWFTADQMYEDARALRYVDFPIYWTWNKKVKRWEMRKKGIKIGRLYYAHPSSGEQYYLRMILHVVRGAMNYQQLQTINGKECPTFKQACIVLGLVGDDNKWDEAIEEASTWATGNNLRDLFAEILLYCEVSNPHTLWEKHWDSLANDIQATLQKDGGLTNYQLSDDDLKNEALTRIENILNKNGKSLKAFSDMPMAKNERRLLPNRLLREELEYETSEIDGEFQKLYAGLNAEQLNIFNQILQSYDNRIGGVFFVNDSGGTEKTYLWRTLCYSLRSRQKIVLTVASSGIVALLLPGGRTAHSRFKIPLQLFDDSCCSISKRSDLAGLIKETSIIIWDEAPITNKYAYDALDQTCRDLLSAIDQSANNKVFDGITIALGWDFRKILPVVPKGQREQIVDASLICSNIWKYCKVFNLTKNMHLENPSTYENIEEVRQFANWILGIGNGSTESVALDEGDESN